jgi:phytoene dehydrogenase-like protein
VDAVVVGSGPNGLTAAVALAEAGRSVRVLEQAATIGGGARTEALTLPGFVHDVCSAVHPLVAGSPAFAGLRLEEHGLRLANPEIPLAHPLDGGRAAVLHRSLAVTAEGLGMDAAAYRRLVGPPARAHAALMGDLLGPLWTPRHPLALARFGVHAVLPAVRVAGRFRDVRARALLAGCAAHSMQPLEAAGTAGFGLVLLLLGHAVGWPVAAGGSAAIPAALAARLRALGGEVETGRPVRSLADAGAARAVLLDVAPAALADIAGGALPARYRRALRRFRHGPGAFKLDYALSGPVPWDAEACRRAGTVHVGGTLEEVAAAEAQVGRGLHPRRPFVLVAQPTLIDPSRAPAGAHTLWAYTHVPAGSRVDMTAAVEAQLERFAPGFRDLVLARHTMGPADLEARNPNLVGGDINGGAATLRQLLARPVARRVPYTTPNPRLFLCSASTPPGGGVHGMCGWLAARAALRGVLRGPG